MLDTAIVGGGLCGVVLARSLHRQGRAVALFEAMPRLGGRILSAASRTPGVALDLGPTWFWPQTQPRVAGLIAELGLASIPQYEAGATLNLRDPDKMPERLEGRAFHVDARRLPGGMASLIDALAADLPRQTFSLGHVLKRVRDRGDHVVLSLSADDAIIEVEARRVVLALPPRLLDQDVRFDPDLDGATREAMQGAGTWMAAQAKVVIGYDRPYWREAGLSGSAFVSHEQAVIGEIFDACDGDGTTAALGGFLALSPDLRASFSVGLPMLMDNQMMQLFGTALEQGEQHYQDWAQQPTVCSARDRDTTQTEHAQTANPLLRRTLWDGRLQLGGSETAAQGAGYLEGALEAAERIARVLAPRAAPTPGKPGGNDHASALNAASLAHFRAWVAAQDETAFDGYRARLNRSLAAQQRDQLTQRAILETMEALFDQAVVVLGGLDFEATGVSVARGRSSLTPAVQEPFRLLMQSLVDDVIAFNRTSCALSNFPDEHHPPKDYMQAILRDIAAAWQEFSLSANRLLLAKMDGGSDPRSQPRRLTGLTS